MTYIFNNGTHSDYSVEYMNEIGIDPETQDSIISMRDYEKQRHAEKEQEWVRSQLVLLDIQDRIISDGDSRSTMTAEEVSARRIALRDYVTNNHGSLFVNGDRPIFASR